MDTGCSNKKRLHTLSWTGGQPIGEADEEAEEVVQSWWRRDPMLEVVAKKRGQRAERWIRRRRRV